MSEHEACIHKLPWGVTRDQVSLRLQHVNGQNPKQITIRKRFHLKCVRKLRNGIPDFFTGFSFTELEGCRLRPTFARGGMADDLGSFEPVPLESEWSFDEVDLIIDEPLEGPPGGNAPMGFLGRIHRKAQLATRHLMDSSSKLGSKLCRDSCECMPITIGQVEAAEISVPDAVQGCVLLYFHGGAFKMFSVSTQRASKPTHTPVHSHTHTPVCPHTQPTHPHASSRLFIMPCDAPHIRSSQQQPQRDSLAKTPTSTNNK